MGPPVGLVYRNDGTIGLDPDAEVQKSLQRVFDTLSAREAPWRPFVTFSSKACYSLADCALGPTRVTCCGRRQGTRALCRCCTIHDTQGLLCMAAHTRAICQTAARELSRSPGPTGSLSCPACTRTSRRPQSATAEKSVRRFRAKSSILRS